MSDRTSPAARKAADAANRGTHYVGSEKSDEDINKATDAAKLTDTTRLGAKKEAGFPSRKDYGSDGEYHSAIRSYRAKQQGQKSALK